MYYICIIVHIHSNIYDIAGGTLGSAADSGVPISARFCPTAFSRSPAQEETMPGLNSLSLSIYIYIYIYMYTCICICVIIYDQIRTTFWVWLWLTMGRQSSDSLF